MAEEEMFDRKVRDKFKDQERPLPPGLWESIDNALPPMPPSSGGTTPYLWWIGGAIGIALVSTLLYFGLSSSDHSNKVANTETSAVQSTDHKSSGNNTYSRHTISSDEQVEASSSGALNHNDENSSTANAAPHDASTSITNSNSVNTSSGQTGSSSVVTAGHTHTGNSANGTGTNSNVDNKGRNTAGVNGGAVVAGSDSQNNNNTTGTTTTRNTRGGGSYHNSPADHNAGDATNGNGGTTQNTYNGSSHTSSGNTTSNTTNANGSTAGGTTAGAVSAATVVTNHSDQNSAASANANNNAGGTDPSMAVNVGAASPSAAGGNTSGIPNQNTNSNMDSTNTANQNPTGNAGGSHVNTQVPVIAGTGNGSAGTNSSPNSSTGMSAPQANKNAGDIDSTHSIMNPAIPEMIAGNPDVVSVMDGSVEDSTKADSTIQKEKQKEENKEKEKQKQDRPQLFSGEVYGGLGYGFYGLGVNPEAVYKDSVQEESVKSRFDNVTKNSTISFSLGLRVNYKISERLEVHAGIGYQQYSNTYGYDVKRFDSVYYAPADSHHLTPLYHYTSIPQSGKDKTTFISLPLGVTYKFMSKDKFSLYGRGAAELRLMNSTGWNTKDIFGNTVASGKPTSSFNMGVYLAAGIQYKLTDKLLLFTEPHTSFAVKNVYGKTDPVKQRPASVGIAIGLRMEF